MEEVWINGISLDKRMNEINLINYWMEAVWINGWQIICLKVPYFQMG